MKYKVLGSIGVLALCFSVAPATRAQTPTTDKPVAIITPNVQGRAAQANAFSLSALAQNGSLAQQGIPSGGQLSWEFQTGRITAEDIVKAGVQANLVSPDALNDQGYIRAIEYNLTQTPIGDN